MVIEEREPADASGEGRSPQHDRHCVVDLDGTWHRIVAMTPTLTTVTDPEGRIRQMTHAPTGQHDDHTLLTVAGRLRRISAVAGNRFHLVDRFGAVETWDLPRETWQGYAQSAAALLVADEPRDG